MRSDRVTLNKAFSTARYGIFHALVDIDTEYEKRLPWSMTTSEADILDSLYLGVRSGGKLCSNFVSNNFGENTYLGDDDVEYLAIALRAIFIDNWDKLYNALVADYNPIHNYNMVEREDSNMIGDKNETLQTEKDTTYTPRSVTKTNEFVYGYNTDKGGGEPSSRTEVEQGGNDVTSVSGGEDSSETENREEHITRTRSGNIGVTTTQKMILEEMEIRKSSFFETVFADLDRILAIPMYDYCLV